MAHPRTVYRCSACSAEAPKWMGRCTACGQWETLVETLVQPGGGEVRPQVLLSAPALPIDQVALPDTVTVSTGVSELDRVLGGGLVAGSVTLLAGEPGIGKSTLTLQVANGLASAGRTVLVVSGEESPAQVRMRAERLGTLRPRLLLASEHGLDEVLAQVEAVGPGALVVDSIQTLSSPDFAGAPGSVPQVAGCAARLIAEAKARDLPVVLVGHVTKEGALAGPRVLEHLVDTVLTFEGERHHALRLLRAVKHRFGPTDELGVLEMTGAGLESVTDPSSLFLSDRRPGVSGSVVVPTIDGHRPLLVEVQALVTKAPAPVARRTAQGLDSGRLGMVLAVFGQRVGRPLGGHDVFALAVGGVRVTEPAADLGIALALASTLTDVPVPPDLVVCGEIGLGGEVRHVHQLERRLTEAVRLGFRRAIVPPATPPIDGLELRPVTTLLEAVASMGALGLGSNGAGSNGAGSNGPGSNGPGTSGGRAA